MPIFEMLYPDGVKPKFFRLGYKSSLSGWGCLLLNILFVYRYFEERQLPDTNSSRYQPRKFSTMKASISRGP